MNLHQKIVVAIMDVCILTEVFVSMYFAAKYPENLTPLFLKYFFGMAVPTLVAARIGIRFLRSPAAVASETAEMAAGSGHN